MRRPSGTIVAKSGATTIKNPSVLWFAPKKPTETLTVADVPTGTGGIAARDRQRGSPLLGRGLRHARSRRLAARRERGPRGQAARRPRARRDVSRCAAAALEAQAIAARTELLAEDRPPQPDRSVPAVLDAAVPGLRRRRQGRPAHDQGGREDARHRAAARRRRPGRHPLQRVVRRPQRGQRRDLGRRGRSVAARPQRRPEGARCRAITDDNLDAFLAEDPTTRWCGQGQARRRAEVPVDREDHAPRI